MLIFPATHFRTILFNFLSYKRVKKLLSNRVSSGLEAFYSRLLLGLSVASVLVLKKL